MGRMETLFSSAAFAAIVATGILPSQPAHAAAAPTGICADFTLFPDDAPLPPTFSLAGFTFTASAGSTPWFVNASGSGIGLQFSNDGGKIAILSPVDRVDLRIGVFASAVDVTVLDASGNQLAQSTLPNSNTFTDVSFMGVGIATILFTGGNNEGSIALICVASSCAEATK